MVNGQSIPMCYCMVNGLWW